MTAPAAQFMHDAASTGIASPMPTFASLGWDE
jgi:hypothetical protein